MGVGNSSSLRRNPWSIRSRAIGPSSSVTFGLGSFCFSLAFSQSFRGRRSKRTKEIRGGGISESPASIRNVLATTQLDRGSWDVISGPLVSGLLQPPVNPLLQCFGIDAFRGPAGNRRNENIRWDLYHVARTTLSASRQIKHIDVAVSSKQLGIGQFPIRVPLQQSQFNE